MNIHWSRIWGFPQLVFAGGLLLLVILNVLLVSFRAHDVGGTFPTVLNITTSNNDTDLDGYCGTKPPSLKFVEFVFLSLSLLASLLAFICMTLTVLFEDDFRIFSGYIIATAFFLLDFFFGVWPLASLFIDQISVGYGACWILKGFTVLVISISLGFEIEPGHQYYPPTRFLNDDRKDKPQCVVKPVDLGWRMASVLAYSISWSASFVALQSNCWTTCGWFVALLCVLGVLGGVLFIDMMIDGFQYCCKVSFVGKILVKIFAAMLNFFSIVCVFMTSNSCLNICGDPLISQPTVVAVVATGASSVLIISMRLVDLRNDN